MQAVTTSARPARRGGPRTVAEGVLGWLHTVRARAMLLLAPGLILLVAVVFIPVLQAIRLAFSSWQGAGAPRFDGLANFRQLGAGSGFGSSLEITGIFTLVGAGGSLLLATGLAWAATVDARHTRLMSVIWFLPLVSPLPVAGVYWSTAFQPPSGVMDYLLGLIGLGSQHAWLASATISIYVVAFTFIWIQTGFSFLVLLGAMRSVPSDLLEAGRLDGCSNWYAFRKIIFPLIMPVFGTVAMLELVATFNSYALIWSMTSGGPGFSTSILAVFVYREAFVFNDYGLASASALCGGIVLTAVAFGALAATKSRVGTAR
jgi:raffinose/stachyose/melibiose transport system permease protein